MVVALLWMIGVAGMVGCGPRAIDGGSVPALSGVVAFDGPRPTRQPIPLSGKGSDCHKIHKKILLDENVLVSKTGGVAR